MKCRGRASRRKKDKIKKRNRELFAIVRVSACECMCEGAKDGGREGGMRGSQEGKQRRGCSAKV